MHVPAQIGESDRGGLVAQNHALRAYEPCQLTGLGTGAGAHVEHGRALGRVERDGREHGGSVLYVDEAEEARQGRTESGCLFFMYNSSKIIIL